MHEKFEILKIQINDAKNRLKNKKSEIKMSEEILELKKTKGSSPSSLITFLVPPKYCF